MQYEKSFKQIRNVDYLITGYFVNHRYEICDTYLFYYFYVNSTKRQRKYSPAAML